MSKPTAVSRGKMAEDLAANYLETLGYQIVQRNFRAEGGEIDLVAFHGKMLCFIEVRARKSVDFGEPLETINREKIRRLSKTARAYLETIKGPWPETRFDALGIVLSDPPQYSLEQDAFEAI